MKSYFKYLLLISFLSGWGAAVSAQDQPEKTRILFIFDASNSMNGKWQKDAKISTAKRVLIDAIDSLKGIPNLEIALRIYGHQSAIIPGDPSSQDCNDTKLEVPFSSNSHEDIKNKIRGVVPKGTTPIALSLEKAADDFPDTKTRNVIILITDGIEACDGDPCRIATALKKKGVSVTPFVVGLGIDLRYLEMFHCIGTFFDVTQEANFEEVLQSVIAQAMNNTTVQISLNDVYGKATESNVGFYMLNQKYNTVAYQYQHTLNYKGNPDTLVMDPFPTYTLRVNTIPPLIKTDIKLEKGTHNVIELDAGQGSLRLKMGSSKGISNVPCIVRQANKMKTTHVQYFGENQDYLVGKYDLEVLTWPRLYFTDVEISQDNTTVIEIPESGTFAWEAFNFQYAAIYKIEGSKMEWVYNIDPNEKVGSMLLLPGNYKIVYRWMDSKKTLQSQEKNFRIYSKSETKLKL